MDEKEDEKPPEGSAPAESEPADGVAEAARPDAEQSEATQPEAPAPTPPATEGAEIPAAGPEADEAPVLPPAEIRAVLEALIYVSPQPITSREIAKVLQGIPKDAWQAALDEIRADYAREGRGLQLVDVANGVQITTRPEYNDWVRELLDPKSPARLSIQALETLAVIAYKQPVTLPEIIELRGVKSGGVIKTLLEKRLIRIVGRKEVVGRPILYGTTRQFLLHFGLKDMHDLPKIEEFVEYLGEEVDVVGLKRAIEAPRPVEVPLPEDAESASPEPTSAAVDAEPLPEDDSGQRDDQ